MDDHCLGCGRPIRFRNIDGITRPLGCVCDRDIDVVRTDRESGEVRTTQTKCFWCSEPVFYHTNGYGDCVLFDALGWPWPVHQCWQDYVNDRQRAVDHLEATSRSRSIRHHLTTDELAEVSRTTNIAHKPAEPKTHRQVVQEAQRSGWRKVGGTWKGVGSKTPEAEPDDFTTCPECGVRVKASRLEDHLFRVHGRTPD